MSTPDSPEAGNAPAVAKPEKGISEAAADAPSVLPTPPRRLSAFLAARWPWQFFVGGSA